jgi:mitochondrial import inner membrane translocase subunit TIM50
VILHLSAVTMSHQNSAVGIYKPADIRPILKAYEGKDVPREYAKFEAAQKAKHVEDWLAKGAKGLGGGGFTLTGLFGGSSVCHSI